MPLKNPHDSRVGYGRDVGPGVRVPLGNESHLSCAAREAAGPPVGIGPRTPSGGFSRRADASTPLSYGDMTGAVRSRLETVSRRWFHSLAVGFVLSSGAGAAPVDVTTLSIVPDDSASDSAAIRAALREHSDLQFPPGKYLLDATVYVPSERRIHGAGKTATIFQLGADIVAFRIEGQHDVSLDNFGIDCGAVGDSKNEAIHVYARNPPTDEPRRVRLEDIRVVNRRSRAPALSFRHTSDCAVRRCEAVDNTRLIWEAPEGTARGDPPMAWQVYGSGITFSHSRDVIVESNSVYETDAHIAIMTAPPPPRYQRYFQGSAIQVVASTNAVIQYNWIKHTGQGIDSNRTNGALIRGNVIENCQSHGIKLAHFATKQRLVDNWIKCAGAMGIALAPGNDEPTSNCTVEGNVFVGIGKGIGEGWWNPTGRADYPACIHLDRAKTVGHGSHDCIIRDNTSYDNDRLTRSVANPIVVVRNAGGPHGAYDLTVENNRILSGPAPGPAPFRDPAQTSAPSGP